MSILFLLTTNKDTDENLQIIVDAIITILKNEDVGEKNNTRVTNICYHGSLEHTTHRSNRRITKGLLILRKKQSLEKKLNKTIHRFRDSKKTNSYNIKKKRDVSDEIMQNYHYILHYLS